MVVTKVAMVTSVVNRVTVASKVLVDFKDWVLVMEDKEALVTWVADLVEEFPVLVVEMTWVVALVTSVDWVVLRKRRNNQKLSM